MDEQRLEKAPEEYVEYVLGGGRDNKDCQNYTIDTKRNKVVETPAGELSEKA